MEFTRENSMLSVLTGISFLLPKTAAIVYPFHLVAISEKIFICHATEFLKNAVMRDGLTDERVGA